MHPGPSCVVLYEDAPAVDAALAQVRFDLVRHGLPARRQAEVTVQLGKARAAVICDPTHEL